MPAPRFGPVAAFVLALSAAPAARADLAEDAERLARAWSDRARVERSPPLFLEHGRARALSVAPWREGDPSCLTVALLGVRTADFFVSRELAAPADADPARPDEPRADRRLRSAGGSLVLSACGPDRAKLGRLDLEMGSPRGTLEILIARSDAPPRDLREILPERAPGPLAPRGDPGGPLGARPLAERLHRASQRARSEGAIVEARVEGRALPKGVGRFDLELVPGCHRLEILADASSAAGPSAGVDIDADVRDASGRVLARDRAELPDARLDLCVGEITPVHVLFAGASGPLPVTLAHARWVMPARVPVRWGPRARAAFAATLHKRRAPDPALAPVFEALGVGGNATSIPLEIEPGRCYLAAVAMVRGEARSIRLAATLGDRVARDDAVERPEGVSASFCAGEEIHVRFDVDVRASSAFWVLALWPMGAVAP